MEIKALISRQIKKVLKQLDKTECAFGDIIFNNNSCQVLSQSAVRFELMVDTQSAEGQVECTLQVSDEDIIPYKNGERLGWDRISYALSLIHI